MLGYQFIAKLNNKQKINLIQVYLGVDKSTIKYMDAKQAIKKVYQYVKKPNFFDNLYHQSFSLFSTPVKSKLVAFF